MSDLWNYCALIGLDNAFYNPSYEYIKYNNYYYCVNAVVVYNADEDDCCRVGPARTRVWEMF